MKTIAFYSYKGGVGRSLVLANTAKYLAKFGQKVVVMDFDLEAPGLHYKFCPETLPPNTLGLIDYISSFIDQQQIPKNLGEYAISTQLRVKGEVKLIWAGNVLSPEYWKKLNRINWHDLFYGEEAQGVPFFLELKERIRESFSPDFLLIDSRSGITEMGGVATTLLADQVMCLFLNNRENLEGTREVLRKIIRSPRLEQQERINITPVVTKIYGGGKEIGKQIQTIKAFLNKPTEALPTGLNLSEIFVLPSMLSDQLSESFFMGSEQQVDEGMVFPLYRGILSQIGRGFENLGYADAEENYDIKRILGKKIPKTKGAKKIS